MVSKSRACPGRLFTGTFASISVSCVGLTIVSHDRLPIDSVCPPSEYARPSTSERLLNFQPIHFAAVARHLQFFCRLIVTAVGLMGVVFSQAVSASDFATVVQPVLREYCFACHFGDDANGNVDFAALVDQADVLQGYATWDAIIDQIEYATMPPPGERQPDVSERQSVVNWYRDLAAAVESKPGVLKPRRLSVAEYRNTLRSVFGFDLEVAIMEAEQTVSEKSLVMKLLPTDPPGASGFKNDTRTNPLTTVVWDQYAYLIDVATEQLFSSANRSHLEALVGPMETDQFTLPQARRLLESIVSRAWRRPVPEHQVGAISERLDGLDDAHLIETVKFEIKAVLMSPHFLYRGLLYRRLLVDGKPGERRMVDDFELAERLSYFLWGDVPDASLRALAERGRLAEPGVIADQIDRMLESTKSRYLSDVFATEWLNLDQIQYVSNDVPKMVALYSQATDFMHYLFTENRPLMEMIESQIAFINPHTARFYGADARQMSRYVKQRGIEVEIVPNQKINLVNATERGGILTMPGILAMNKGPILRGTWMLECILGQRLPEPPANVGQVPPNSRGEQLSFRERFEQHRRQPTCAVCHDRIDPLGFAFERFNEQGQYLSEQVETADKKAKRGSSNRSKSQVQQGSEIDTSGKLPSGETFRNHLELKKILTTSRREDVTRNIVERTMAFALCRALTIHDRPTVDQIVERMVQTDGTWRDLFVAVVTSVPFRETILSGMD